MDTADIFTIVYGSSYLMIVVYLSIYCWIKLEDELIFIIQKITVEYKKITSATDLEDVIGDGTKSNNNSLEFHNPTQFYQFSFQSSSSPIIAQRIQKHLNASGHNSTSFSYPGSIMSIPHGSFLRPIPDMYYEKFIKPFDIYEDEEIKEDNTTPTIEEEKKENMLRLSSVSPRKRGGGKTKNPIGFGVKFFYWVWVTWNMSAIYGLLIIHIWDMGTDIAVMIKWYEDGSTAATKWLSDNGDIDLLALFALSILFILTYRIIASLMIYSLTKSLWRVISQLIFDLEIYRTIFISFKLKLSEPGYIQTWLQKLEATFESLPQAVLQLSYLARIENWNEEDDSTVVITSILLSLVTMAERFERDDKLYFPYNMYYITKETPPYISFPYMVRYSWRLCEVTCRTFIFVLVWLTIGGYLLSAIFTVEALIILYAAKREGKYDFLSYFVAIPLVYLKQRRTWSLTFIRLIEHMIMLAIVWMNVFFDFQCVDTFGCFSNEKIRKRLWLTNNNEVTFGFILLICTTAMTFITPALYYVIWKWYIVQDISRLMATQERDIWIITKTGDIRGLTEMIQFGVNPDLRNLNNETLLHVYFRSYITYNQSFVNVLSNHEKFYMGAMSSPARRTILHAAVSHSMPSMPAIKFLLNLGNVISVNDIDSDGKTALMYYLCANKYREGLESGFGFNNNNLTFMRDANFKILELMTDEKYKLRPEIRDHNGNCIIHYACENQMMSDNNIEFIINLYLNAIERMLDNECRINEEKTTDDDDIRRDTMPALGTSPKIINEERSASVHGPKGSEVLTGKEQIEIYRKRLQKSTTHQWDYVKGNVDVKNRFHQTPFMFYLGYNSMVSNSMINLFLEHKMDPLIRDGFRNSVFHWAVKNPSINQTYGCDALRFMCEQIEVYGSLMDAFLPNAKQESIFHTYFLENTQFNKDIILLFLDYKVDINTVDLKGNTCLHYASKNKYVNEEFLLFLLSSEGGNTINHIDVKNVENQTPFDNYKNNHSQQQLQSLINKIEKHNDLKHKVNVDRNNNASPITLKNESQI